MHFCYLGRKFKKKLTAIRCLKCSHHLDIYNTLQRKSSIKILSCKILSWENCGFFMVHYVLKRPSKHEYSVNFSKHSTFPYQNLFKSFPKSTMSLNPSQSDTFWAILQSVIFGEQAIHRCSIE